MKTSCTDRMSLEDEEVSDVNYAVLNGRSALPIAQDPQSSEEELRQAKRRSEKVWVIMD